MSEEMITITRKKYDQLLEDELTLAKLEAHGVDNWIGYEDAMQD